MHKTYLIFSYSAVLIFSCAISGGCSKKKEIPEPPTAHSELVLSLFSALDKKDHSLALGKIERLRQLDSGNLFLANLEIKEKNNEMISGIQNLLDEGKIEDAVNLTNDFILKHGRNEEFVSIQNELQVIKQLKETIDALNDPSSSTRLARNAAKLKAIASRYKPAEAFIPYANGKLAIAKKLFSTEKKMAVEDLSLEITGLMLKKDPTVANIMAILAIENPEHPVIMGYMDYIGGLSDKASLNIEKTQIKQIEKVREL
jgi:hypothetical protein